MITIYWSVPDDGNMTGLRVHEPVPLISHFIKDKNLSQGLEFNKCPAFRENLDNIFVFKSSMPFKFGFEENQIWCDETQRNLLEKVVQIRSLQERCFLLNFRHIFFTEMDSLKISLSGTYLDDNDFSNNTIVIPGTFDIGKWFRKTECSFYIKKGNRLVSAVDGTPIYYIKFHTNEKIKFKRFVCTAELDQLIKMTVDSRAFSNNKHSSMEWFYNIFQRHSNFKKLILKKIKNNLID